MKRAFLVLWILTASQLHSEIIDRMMAVVNNHIVTLSDVRREHKIRSVLGENESQDDKVFLQTLIDAQLVQEQVAEFPGIEVAESEVQAQMDKIQDLQGLPRSVVRDAILKRLQTSQFLDLRFRQFLSASDDEILKYYQTVFVPEAQKRGMTPIPGGVCPWSWGRPF